MFDKLSQQNVRIIQGFISPGESTLGPGESTFSSGESTQKSGETSSGKWVIGWNDRNSEHVYDVVRTCISVVWKWVVRKDVGTKKPVSAADKPFEGISKVVCERINHSQLDNVNGYQKDEDFLWTDGSAIWRAEDFDPKQWNGTTELN